MSSPQTKKRGRVGGGGETGRGVQYLGSGVCARASNYARGMYWWGGEWLGGFSNNTGRSAVRWYLNTGVRWQVCDGSSAGCATQPGAHAARRVGDPPRAEASTRGRNCSAGRIGGLLRRQPTRTTRGAQPPNPFSARAINQQAARETLVSLLFPFAFPFSFFG